MSEQIPGTIRQALTKSLEALDPEDADAVLVALLYAYADGLDDGEESLKEVGTGFTTAMRQMGIGPAARAAITGNGQGAKQKASGLSLLQSDRQRATGKAG